VPAAMVCRTTTTNSCATVVCTGGTTCDPNDGQCKCGGPGGPSCGNQQLCQLQPAPQCVGGQQCTQSDGGVKACTGGTSCDPEDGKCKCGGRGGLVCDAITDVCVSSPQGTACRRPCDPLAPCCPFATFCFFDSAASPKTAFCGLQSGSLAAGQSCDAATACFSSTPADHALVCAGLAVGQSGTCRAFCSVSAGGCPSPQTCTAIAGAPANVGACTP
jgi:hypothetical protein